MFPRIKSIVKMIVAGKMKNVCAAFMIPLSVFPPQGTNPLFRSSTSTFKNVTYKETHRDTLDHCSWWIKTMQKKERKETALKSLCACVRVCECVCAWVCRSLKGKLIWYYFFVFQWCNSRQHCEQMNRWIIYCKSTTRVWIHTALPFSCYEILPPVTCILELSLLYNKMCSTTEKNVFYCIPVNVNVRGQVDDC